MNSEQRWLTLPKNTIDSVVNILDPENLLETCNLKKWRGFKINVINSGTFIDSVRRGELH
jgi:hypothetical protein